LEEEETTETESAAQVNDVKVLVVKSSIEEII
jgi:hypothetical protein